MSSAAAKLHGVEGLVRLLVETKYYEIFCVLNIAAALYFFFRFSRHPLRIGRFYRPGTSRLRLEIADR
jgi:hypothetical protein